MNTFISLSTLGAAIVIAIITNAYFKLGWYGALMNGFALGTIAGHIANALR